jgi:hypothetical protein
MHLALPRYFPVGYSLGRWSSWCYVSTVRLSSVDDPHRARGVNHQVLYSQYPIDPGATYTYTYTPLQYGQYW